LETRVKVATYLAQKATIVRDYGDGRGWRGDKSVKEAYDRMVAESAAALADDNAEVVNTDGL
jgi:hypothetical protein